MNKARVFWMIGILVFALQLGCSSEQGTAGADGVDGIDGADGADGTSPGEGPLDPSDDDVLALMEEEGNRMEAEITGVTIGSAPIVEFSLADQGGNPLLGLPDGGASFTIAKLAQIRQ